MKAVSAIYSNASLSPLEDWLLNEPLGDGSTEGPSMADIRASNLTHSTAWLRQLSDGSLPAMSSTVLAADGSASNNIGPLSNLGCGVGGASEGCVVTTEPQLSCTVGFRSPSSPKLTSAASKKLACGGHAGNVSTGRSRTLFGIAGRGVAPMVSGSDTDDRHLMYDPGSYAQHFPEYVPASWRL